MRPANRCRADESWLPLTLVAITGTITDPLPETQVPELPLGSYRQGPVRQRSAWPRVIGWSRSSVRNRTNHWPRLADGCTGIIRRIHASNDQIVSQQIGSRCPSWWIALGIIGLRLFPDQLFAKPTTLSGRDEAKRDLSHRTLKLYLYGEPTPAHAQFTALFAELCQGTVEQLAPNDRRPGPADSGPNRRVLQEVARRHGRKAVTTLCDRWLTPTISFASTRVRHEGITAHGMDQQ